MLILVVDRNLFVWLHGFGVWTGGRTRWRVPIERVYGYDRGARNPRGA